MFCVLVADTQNRDAIVGISVYQQKCMTRFDGKYVLFYIRCTDCLRHFPTYAIMYGLITPAVGAEPSPHEWGTIE
jgi:hypothetical protein